MTKARPPLSIENAITRIAGRLGWEKCSDIVGQAERTVRNWSDPDTDAVIPIKLALKLDAAYIADGGEDAPICDAYQTMLDIAVSDACGCTDALAEQTALAAKETGEALSALVRASRRGASRADRIVAARETEEAIVSLKGTLPSLAAGAELTRGEG